MTEEGGRGEGVKREVCSRSVCDLPSFQSRLIYVYEKELNVHTSFFPSFPFFFFKIYSLPFLLCNFHYTNHGNLFQVLQLSITHVQIKQVQTSILENLSICWFNFKPLRKKETIYIQEFVNKTVIRFGVSYVQAFLCLTVLTFRASYEWGYLHSGKHTSKRSYN